MKGARVAEPVVLSWSGGKDSALSLAALGREQRWEVTEILTTVNAEFDRIVMHGVRRELLERQASALALPLRVVRLPPDPSNEEYDRRMLAELESIRAAGIDTVAFGDLFLEEVRAYRESSLRKIGFQAIFPLWREPTEALARRFVDDGFRAIITCVDTTQLDGSFSGREFDAQLLEELPSNVDPCGENGEFHTFVFDGPIFRHPLTLTIGERILRDDRFMYCDLV